MYDLLCNRMRETQKTENEHVKTYINSNTHKNTKKCKNVYKIRLR